MSWIMVGFWIIFFRAWMQHLEWDAFVWIEKVGLNLIQFDVG